MRDGDSLPIKPAKACHSPGQVEHGKTEKPPSRVLAADLGDEVLAVWVRSPEFLVRCREMQARIESGEPMTLEYLGQQLGLSWSFFASCFADLITMQTGLPVVINDEPMVRN